MNKPDYYLKRIGQRGKIEIWLVDGRLEWFTRQDSKILEENLAKLE